MAPPGLKDHLLELHRLSLGEPAYTPPAQLSAYDYGPVYVTVLNGLRAIVGQPVDLAHLSSDYDCARRPRAVPVGFAAAAVAWRAVVESVPVSSGRGGCGGLLGLDVLAHNLDLREGFIPTIRLPSCWSPVRSRSTSQSRPEWCSFACVGDRRMRRCRRVHETERRSRRPLLLAGLAAAGTISWRRILSLRRDIRRARRRRHRGDAGGDARMDRLDSPRHRYQFSAEKFSGAAAALTIGGPSSGGTIVVHGLRARRAEPACGEPSALDRRRRAGGRRSAALPPTSRNWGIFNNLTILAAATTPYAGAAIGLLYALARGAGGVRATMLMLILGALLTASLARFDDRSAPAISLAEQHNVARMEALADGLCAGNPHGSLVRAPQRVLRCRSAFCPQRQFDRTPLSLSRYDPGPTVFDRPSSLIFSLGRRSADPRIHGLLGYHRIIRRSPAPPPHTVCTSPSTNVTDSPPSPLCAMVNLSPMTSIFSMTSTPQRSTTS